MQDKAESRAFPIAFVAGIGVILCLLGAIFLLTDYSRKHAPAEQRLTISDADKEYVARIQISDIRMSRAENMLGHELTYIVATLTNNGTKTIGDIEFTVEFKDMLAQVVLREQRRPFGKEMQPLPGGQSRDFQLTFEAVPKDWNVQYPTMRVTGLRLE
jgi:hypothetical protein